MDYVLAVVWAGTVLWVSYDARRRDWGGNQFANRAWKWVAGAFLLWMIVVPVYVFQRNTAPLKARSS